MFSIHALDHLVILIPGYTRVRSRISMTQQEPERMEDLGN